MSEPSRSSARRLGRVAADGRLVGLVVLGSAVEHEPQPDGGRAVDDRLGHLPCRRRGDQHPRPAVVDDVGGLLRGQLGADGGVEETGSERGPGDGQEPRVVLQEEGDVVTRPEPGRVQQVGELVRLLVELPVGDHLAGGAHDHRRPVGCRRGVDCRIHGRRPYRPAPRNGSRPADVRGSGTLILHRIERARAAPIAGGRSR